MSRKRKSTEILAQLGEPLPLPYRANTQQVILEPSEEAQEVTYSQINNPIRRRRRFERRDLSSNSIAAGPILETRHVDHAHVPLPIWRRDRGMYVPVPTDSEREAQTARHEERGKWRNEERNDERKEERKEERGEERREEREEDILDILQQHLDKLRTLYDKDALEADEDQFVEVSAMLEQMANRKREESIVYELERIQHMSMRVEERKGNKWKVAFWMLVVMMMVLASFLAGHYSNEYMYDSKEKTS